MPAPDPKYVPSDRSNLLTDKQGLYVYQIHDPEPKSESELEPDNELDLDSEAEAEAEMEMNSVVETYSSSKDSSSDEEEQVQGETDSMVETCSSSDPVEEQGRGDGLQIGGGDIFKVGELLGRAGARADSSVQPVNRHI